MQRRRQLNIPLIKGIVMFCLSVGLASASALTGIGAQVATAPMISFLLGFTPEKCAGTALAFSLFAAGGAIVGASSGGLHLNIESALLLAVGAFLGVSLTDRAAQPKKMTFWHRIGQSAGILLGLMIFREAFVHKIGGPYLVPLDFLRTAPGMILVGGICGALSNLLQVTISILMVPAIVYLTAKTTRPMPEAISISLIGVAIAALLPTLSYSSRQLIDRRMGKWMAAGGAAGGLAGGYLLSVLAGSGGPALFILFGVISMFLCAWMLWKLS
jgi:uncharacterized membrane protein YfcA